MADDRPSEPKPKFNRLALVVGITGLVTGGLGGAVFTWYINRPKPTVVTYNIVSTSTGADATTKGLVPNLKLRIRNEDVAVIYTHTVDFLVQSGPQIESAVIAVKFHQNVRIFGLDSQPPSPLHHMTCSREAFGAQCDMGPLAPGGHATYRLSVATDQPHPEEILTAANKLELVKVEDYVGTVQRARNDIFVVASVLFVGMLGSFLAVALLERRRRELEMRTEGELLRRTIEIAQLSKHIIGKRRIDVDDLPEP